jgi:hypothetical protein
MKVKSGHKKYRIYGGGPGSGLKFCSKVDSETIAQLKNIDTGVDVPNFEVFQSHIAPIPGSKSKAMHDMREWKLTPTPGVATTDCRWINDTTNAAVFTIPNKRLVKALQKLSVNNITKGNAILGYRQKICCKKECANKFEAANIRDLRYAHLQLPDEPASLSFFVRDMRRFYDHKADNRRVAYMLGGKPVCARYYHAAMGVSMSKLDSARIKASHGASFHAHGNLGKRYITGTEAGVKVKSFWTYFYDTLCQIISDKKRLRPHNLVMEDLYDSLFISFCERTWDGQPVPSLSCFIKGSKDKEFADVTKQPKHNHCKCTTCFSLMTRKLAAFKTMEDMDKVIADTRAHDEEVRAWRAQESYYYMQAQHNPQKVNVFMADDTSAVEFPKAGRRPVKSTANIQRVCITPWLVEDVSRKEKTYVYTPKRSYPKGGNRWCTQMFAMIKSVKLSGLLSAQARKLVMIFDNASDNKNNINLAFASHLIAKGWYDEIQILYGPVGHTHNGIDAAHKIHNQGLGRYFSSTLVEWVNKYPQAWRNTPRIPKPAICDIQLDWTGLYTPVIDKIAGCWKTAKNPGVAQGFKICRDDTNNISVKWRSGCALSDPWLGVGGKVDAPGFVILTGLPGGVPKVVPRKNSMTKRGMKSMTGQAITALLESQGEAGAMEWLKTVGATGRIPILEYLEEKVPPGSIGRKALIGWGAKSRAEVRVIDKTIADMTSVAAFWYLPPDVLEMMDRQRRINASRFLKPIADVHYAKPRPEAKVSLYVFIIFLSYCIYCIVVTVLRY